MDGKLTGGKGVTVAELRGTDQKEEEPTPDSKSGPVESVKVEPIKPAAAPEFREIEVIRAGASTSVRVNLPSNDAVTGTQEKLLGNLPKD
jgi:hypothetical protein